MTATRKLVPAASLVVLALLTGGCGTDVDGGGAPDGGSSQTPVAGAEASAEPSPEPTAEPEVEEPEEEPAPERPTAPPEKSVAAGTVAEGSAATAEGKGDAEVTFERDGEFAVVVELDCARCEGPTVLTGPDRMTPFGEADGALTGEYLMDVFQDSEPEQSLWVAADGPWSLRLSSWNDLTPEPGPWSGSGSTVIFLGGDAETAEVSWTPAGAGDSFQGRYFGTEEAAARMFGDSEEFTDDIELAQPGVLAITTDGEWSITPG
ncbi:hypothetical protein GCM10009718_22620 [Isoptericola halotolerans]|uniref:Lipoprotein n=1 Tax=Isoptericola halotolerans TaxID=300560 RepID=A0ABX2A7F0_9MICO|nr:hypothetical protein [Isoptericola halotolerans]NOV98804.1 hypothetical protein [Isoptericola halotolerans]